MERDQNLALFLDAAKLAFVKYGGGRTPAREQAQAMVERAFSALEKVAPVTKEDGQRLPVVDAWLSSAVSIQLQDEGLQKFVTYFQLIESQIRWKKREKLDMNTASANIVDSHANGMIFGPGGIEEREDVWLGLTLLAPHTRYPDHNHPPAEVYLNLSDGEFFQDGSGWFAPGIGGSFYNVPFIRHAMRSAQMPLFAFWLLYNGN